jgi:AbiJ N-terminal domain 4
MKIIDLFSKRQKRLRGDMPDVFVYDSLPAQLRVQIVHVWRDALGEERSYGGTHVSSAYDFIHDALCREYGLFDLLPRAKSHEEAVVNFFLQEESVERALDVVELCFQVVNGFIRENQTYRYNTKRALEPDGAIAELNERFKESTVGYAFESNELIRIDSQFVHAEAVKPTLGLLRSKDFAGANEEFLSAHQHYRHGRHKECLVDALKALESTMKAICKRRKWQYQPADTAKALLGICFANGLIPSYLESQFSSLRSLLESGVPTVRNKLGGHGQGSDPFAVPEFMARYALNMTATSILFLAEADAAKSE